MAVTTYHHSPSLTSLAPNGKFMKAYNILQPSGKCLRTDILINCSFAIPPGQA